MVLGPVERLVGDSLSDDVAFLGSSVLLSRLVRPIGLSNAALIAIDRSHCIFLAGLGRVGWLFDVVLHREHVVVLDAVGERLDGHFRSEHIILNALGLPYKIVDVLEQTAGNLVVGPGVLAVLVEREDVVDVVDE